MRNQVTNKTLIAVAQATMALAVVVSAQAQEIPANEALDQHQVAQATSQQQHQQPQQEPEKPATKAGEKAAEAAPDSKNESGVRFVVKKGSGSATQVSKSKEVRLPQGPLAAEPEDINKLLGEAQKVGGQALDPVQREINMPGLKKDDPALKPFVLHTRNGVNEIVKMSSRLLNRVATPFKKPVVIDTSESTSKIVGSDVYFMPAGNTPIGLFIADSSNTSQTVSLTIIPDETIPGQNLIVKLEDLRTVRSLTGVTEAESQIAHPQATDYTSMVRTLMASAARGSIPGFSPVPLEGGVAKMDDLTIEPEFTFAGSVADIYRYRLVNNGAQPVDLVETAFFRQGVKAVSFFPYTSLKPGQESYVFILADKPESAAQGDGQ